MEKIWMTVRRGRRGGSKRQRTVPKKPRYKTIAVGLYEDQALLIDRTATELQKAGYPKANRSFLFQTLVRRLTREIEGKTSDEILQYFLDFHLRRPLSQIERPETDERQRRSRSA